MKDFARDFYFSPAWRNMRVYILKRDKYLCRDCLDKGLFVPAEEVHHIVPLTAKNINNTDITLSEDNLISLCRLWHRARHTYNNSRRNRRYTVDDD